MKVKGLHLVIFALLGFIFGFAIHSEIAEPVEVVKVVRDTITNTITIEKPVEVESREAGRLRAELSVARSVIDSLRALEPEIVEKVDSLYIPVEVPIEEKVYQDSTYRAVVSGYRPRLEYLELYQKEIRVTETITRKAPRWSFSVTAGPGVFVGFDGIVRPGGGIVVGVGYNLGK